MKQQMKKATGVLLALLLAVLVFPGAGILRAEATELDRGVLTTKVQTTNGIVTSSSVEAYQGKYVMRFVSSVGDPSLYRRVGFQISYEANSQTVTKTYTTYNVFKHIESTTGSTAGGRDQYTFTPKVISAASEYFFTAKWPVAPEDAAVNYTVRAFAVLQTGETVYGPSRCASVSGGIAGGNLNLTFDQALDAGKTYTATYTNAAGEVVDIPAANVEILPVFDGETNHANVRLTNADTSLKAVTEVTLSDGNNVYITKLRNLYAPYTGEADTSWYDAGETEFVLTSAAELHGLSALAVSNNFSGKTVYLASDIKLNSGNAADWATTAPAYTFTPIGGDSGSFRGTFDGQGHTISGVYATGAHRIALFGNAYDATIRNFRLTNSYLASSTGINGSIVGNFRGTIEKVYSNAIISVTGAATSGNAAAYATGGMVGRVDSVGATFNQCWFDGVITTNGTRTGGIVGEHFANGVTADVIDCLVTGDITTTVQQQNGCAGGFLGQTWSSNTSSAPRLNVTNSVFAGTMTHGYTNGNMVGLAVGNTSTTSATGGVWLSNCYCAPSNNWNVVGWQANTATVTDDNGATKYTGSCTALSTKYRKSVAEIAGLIGSWNDDAWCVLSDGSPMLKVFADKNAKMMDLSWYDASASEYTISTAEQFYGLSWINNNVITTGFSGKTVRLDADIALNEGTVEEWKANNFDGVTLLTPIGGGSTNANAFRGTFDGQGHTISGVYMTGTQRMALFGNAYDVTIRNLKLTNTYIKSTGGMNGAIGGNFRGTLSDIYTDAEIVVEGTNAADLLTGGMAGRLDNAATFTRCWFDGVITTNGKCTGGILGGMQNINATATIQDCLVTGTLNSVASVSNHNQAMGGMVGSLVGMSGATVLNLKTSVFSGTFTTTDASANMVGFLVGAVNGSNLERGLWLTNCYGTGSGKGAGPIGYQLGGMVTDDGGVTKYTGGCAGLTSKYAKSAGAIMLVCDQGGLSDAWCNVVPGRTILAAFAGDAQQIDMTWYDAGETTFTLTTSAQLLGLAPLSEVSGDIFSGKTVKLGADIAINKGTVEDWKANDFADLIVWTPVGITNGFRGSFDGQGHTISGIYVNDDGRTGLFANAYDGVIRDFRLTNSYLTTTTGITGGIVGNFRGTIEKVYTDAEIVSTLSGSGLDGYTGGIVGRIASNVTISECWFDGVITSNGKDIGGIVGGFVNESATLTVANCLVSGTLNSLVDVNNQVLGGIVGAVVGMSGATKAYLNSNIFTGTLTTANANGNMVGFLVGVVNGNSLERGLWLNGSYGVGSGKGANPVGYRLGGMVTDDGGTTQYTGSCTGLTTKYAKTLSALTVEATGLDGAIWQDSANGPVLIAFAA